MLLKKKKLPRNCRVRESLESAVPDYFHLDMHFSGIMTTEVITNWATLAKKTAATCFGMDATSLMISVRR